MSALSWAYQCNFGFKSPCLRLLCAVKSHIIRLNFANTNSIVFPIVSHAGREREKSLRSSAACCYGHSQGHSFDMFCGPFFLNSFRAQTLFHQFPASPFYIFSSFSVLSKSCESFTLEGCFELVSSRLRDSQLLLLLSVPKISQPVKLKGESKQLSRF